MTTENQDEVTRKAAQDAAQEQAERDFVAAREQLAQQDEAQRQAEPSEQEAERPTYWRADTGFSHDRDATAADVVRHEQNELGNDLDNIAGEQLAALEEIPAKSVMWVTENKEDAARYGTPEPVDLGRHPVEIAHDGEGGLLMVHGDHATDALRSAFAGYNRFFNGETAQPEALTHEAIERDPWNAVNLPMPETDDCELLEKIEQTAGKLAEDVYTQLYDSGEGDRAALNSTFQAITSRQAEARAAIDAQACELEAGSDRQPDAPEIDPADSFRHAADTTTNTAQQQRERDLGERIVALESLLGSEDSRDHHDYIAAQRTYSERIDQAPNQDAAAFWLAGRFAHAQDYAADLCDQAGIKAGMAEHYEEAAALAFEGRTHREIAGGIRGGQEQAPDLAPQAQDGRADVAADMEAAAAEALGRTVKAAVIVDGPSSEQQQGQRADAPEIVSEPSARGRYEALQPDEPQEDRARVADYGYNIRPVLEVSPEGTYVASRPQSSLAGQETDYEAGPVRPGLAAYAALAATQATAREDRDDDSAVMTENADKAKREAVSAEQSRDVDVTASRTANDAGSKPLTRAERAELAAAQHAEEAERESEGGHAMSGMGGGRGGR